MPRKVAAVVVLTLVAFGPIASADSLSATLGEPLDEVSHDVRISVRDGVATMTVQRVFSNAGSIPDEAVLEVLIPGGAAATGLRIKAGKRWFSGDLLAADEALEKYAELTGRGVAELKDPALLSWLDVSRLELRVFPIPAGKTSTVEYTLTVPVGYEDGRQIVTYPRQDPDEEHLALPVVRVDTREADIWVDGAPVQSSLQFVSTGTEYQDPLSIALPAPAFDVARGRLGVAEASAKKRLVRFELEAAPKITAMPRSLALVFVIDASTSVDTAGIIDALEIVRSVASHAPDAVVEVVAFRRHASRVFGELIPASELGVHLVKARAAGLLDPANGSSIEAGLLEARKVLARHRGSARIIAVTDGLMRTPFTNAAAHRALKRLRRSAAVHVVIPDSASDLDGDYADQRDDDHDMAPIALSHGGVLLGFDPDAKAEAVALSTLGLIRPIRIDHLRVTGKGLTEPVAQNPYLSEGQSIEAHRWYASAPRKLKVSGMLWSAPYQHTLHVSKRYSKAAAAFVFGSDGGGDLSEAEMEKLAKFGGAVSPVTSYLAIEPGVQPSMQGLVDREGGFGGLIGTEIGEAFGVGGALVRRSSPPVLDRLVAPMLAECFHRHEAAESWRGSLSVELTANEIVDVAAPGAEADPLLSCVVEKVWSLALGDEFSWGRRELTVALAAPRTPAP